MVIQIDDRHPFNNPPDERTIQRRKQMWEQTQKRLIGLSPSKRRMIAAIVRALMLWKDNEFGHAFMENVNRESIAHQLEKDRLVAWDIKVLRQLCELGFIRERREALMTRNHQARGAQFTYSMNDEMLWCLVRLMERKRRGKPDEKLPRN